MIDRLAEVLGETQPAEVRNFLPEQLRQAGQLAVPPAEKENAGQTPEQGTENSGLQEPLPAVFPVERTTFDGVPAEEPEAGNQTMSRNGQEGVSALAALVGQALEGEHILPAVKQSERTAQALSAVRNLYRRAVEGVQTGLPAGPRPSPVVIREVHPAGNGLTVRELDLAVRRDSRRYDGAMHIY